MVETKPTREELKKRLTGLLDKLGKKFTKPVREEYLHMVMEAEREHGPDFALPYMRRYSELLRNKETDAAVMLLKAEGYGA